MAQIEYIKYLYENEGKSLSYISKTMGLDFRTVKKYAENYDWSPNHKMIKRNRYPVLGPFIETIDNWLTEDLKCPRKQRHTAQRVFDRLVDEFNFKGSIRTVSDYVAKKKKELYEKSSGYLPLQHTPGEAQLDFGEFVYTDGENQKKAYYLNLSFPYSNAAFVQVFESQNQECLMEGLKRIFNYIEGVPHVIVMDNMRSVVTKILPNGEREITDSFKAFSLHYRFRAVFCNPSSGNEKGNVESKVGYHRRNFFVPVPEIQNIEEFNKALWDKCTKDMERVHYQKQQPILYLWEQDRQQLLYMPENEFNVFKLKEASVDKYGFVEYDDNKYSITPELSGEIVTVKAYFNKVEIYHDHNLIVTYNRCYGKKEEIIDWRQYISILSKKPGALENTRFYEQIPKLWREHLKKVNRREKKTALMLLKEIVDNDALELGNDALALSYEYGKTDVESIRQIYYGLTHDSRNLEPCKFNIEPPQLNYEPELSVYDSLSGRQVV